MVMSHLDYFYVCLLCKADDSRAILCKDCYKGSSHRRENHPVEIRRYIEVQGAERTLRCHCGALNAWKCSSFGCNNHQRYQPHEQAGTCNNCQLFDPSTAAASSSRPSRLAPDPSVFSQRATIVFTAILDNCVELYTAPRLPSGSVNKLPEHLALSNEEERLMAQPFNLVAFAYNYVTLLYHDARNENQQELLGKCIATAMPMEKEDPRLRSAFMELLKDEGRALVCFGDYRACAAARSKLQKAFENAGLDCPTVEVKGCIRYFQEEFSKTLVDWTLDLITESDPMLREICCNLLFTTDGRQQYRGSSQPVAAGVDDGPSSAAARTMSRAEMIIGTGGSSMWTSLRLLWQKLLLAVLDHQNKQQSSSQDEPEALVELTQLIGRKYPDLLAACTKEGQTLASSFISLDAIFFKYSSSALLEVRLQTRIFSVLCETLESAHRMEMMEDAIKQPLRAISWLLSKAPTTGPTEEDRQSFLKGFKAFVTFLSSVMEKSCVELQTWSGPVITKPAGAGWSVSLQDDLNCALQALLHWCQMDSKVFQGVLRITCENVAYRVASDKNTKRWEQRCEPQHDGSSGALPLGVYTCPTSTRLLSSTIAMSMNHADRLGLSEEDIRCSVKQVVKDCLAYPLRLRVLETQIVCGSWKAIGPDLLEWLEMSRSIRLGSEMHDRDLFLLQYAATIDPDHFIQTVTHEFGVSFERLLHDSSGATLTTCELEDGVYPLRIASLRGVIQLFLDMFSADFLTMGNRATGSHEDAGTDADGDDETMTEKNLLAPVLQNLAYEFRHSFKYADQKTRAKMFATKFCAFDRSLPDRLRVTNEVADMREKCQYRAALPSGANNGHTPSAASLSSPHATDELVHGTSATAPVRPWFHRFPQRVKTRMWRSTHARAEEWINELMTDVSEDLERRCVKSPFFRGVIRRVLLSSSGGTSICTVILKSLRLCVMLMSRQQRPEWCLALFQETAALAFVLEPNRKKIGSRDSRNNRRNRCDGTTRVQNQTWTSRSRG